MRHQEKTIARKIQQYKTLMKHSSATEGAFTAPYSNPNTIIAHLKKKFLKWKGGQMRKGKRNILWHTFCRSRRHWFEVVFNFSVVIFFRDQMFVVKLKLQLYFLLIASFTRVRCLFHFLDVWVLIQICLHDCLI